MSQVSARKTRKICKASATPAGRRKNLVAASLLLVAGCLAAHAQVNVTTWQNDSQRTGQNLGETILTPSNVNPTQFGKLFSQSVDGVVYAQPLYLSNVSINGQTHNVVFVATEHDSVYAFDADTNGGANGLPLWQASMLSTAHGAAAGATTVSYTAVGASDIYPEIGITGTPVIDPGSGNNPASSTLYVVSKSEEGGAYIQRLHALDVTSGAEKFGGPVVITATISGTGNGSAGGVLTFDPLWENQRPALLLLNGIVYVGFAAHGDNGPWHGWIIGYNASTLKQTGAYCPSPNGSGSGFWMSGAGLAGEINDPTNHPYGRMFVPTGNGDYTAAKPYNAGMDFGDSILNLDLASGTPTLQDEFTPSTQAHQDLYDLDQGSGGLTILPAQSAGSYPNLLVQTGKNGCVMLLNREGLGGYNSISPAPSACGGDNVVQELPTGLIGSWSTPAYWNGTIYYSGARSDNLKSFPLVNGLMTGPSAASSETFGYIGSTPSISANGTSGAIVWNIDSSGFSTNAPDILEAHDATNVASTLYSSSVNPSRDNPGPAVRFAVPVVANGKVYIAAEYQLSIFGLFSSQPVTAAPVIGPPVEYFSSSLNVTLTDATPGATIYYTLDGSVPTLSSAVYSPTTGITITDTTTIMAMASANSYDQSPVSSATYNKSSQFIAPVLSPGTGSYTQPVLVTITEASSGATVYYTTDGSNPATSSTAIAYSNPFLVSSTETVNAIATGTGLTNSNVASATYTLNIGQTGIDFPMGFIGTQGTTMIFNGSTVLDDDRLQLTDGGQNEAGSAWYYQPVNVQSFSTFFTFQLSTPNADGVTFTIQGQGTSALGQSGGGLGYATIPNSVAIKFDLYNNNGEGGDSTGLYINGAVPETPAIDLSSTGINLHGDDATGIQLAYNGSVLSMTIYDFVTQTSYSTSWVVNIPAIVGGNTAYVGFTGGTEELTSSQKILNWTYDTGSSALPVATTPIYSPVGNSPSNPTAGNYTSAQSVTLSSLTAGATIYYTTDGSVPTTASQLYTSTTPINVSASESINAVAIAPGYSASSVGVGTYVINGVLPPPTFTPVAGNYPAAQNVAIIDAVPGATIYYTVDGSTPTTSSTPFTEEIYVTGPVTLKAIAVLSGYSNSAVASASYTIAPSLSLSATSLSYGTEAVGGTSNSQQVTLTNTGTSTVVIGSIVFSGPNVNQFAFANNCGTSIIVGGNCIIHGHFAPTTAGPKTAVITITDNAIGSPQTIAISGTGAGPTDTLSATSISFGSINVGSSSSQQSVTVTNSGTAALSIASIAVGGANANQFAFTNTCGSSLAVGSSCSIQGYFEPTSAGPMAAAITLTDSASDSPQTIALSGTGVSASQSLSFSATSIPFGPTTVGTWSPLQLVTMTNNGATTITISGIAVTGANASQFVFANDCGTSLAAGASCTIHGHFQPTSTGPLTAAVTITDSAPASPQSIALTGTGVASSTPVTLAPTSIAFGGTTVGTWSGLQAVSMTNTGTAALSISSIAVTGANASQFVFANTCGTSLAVGASCSIHGHFQPTSTGALSAAITITDSAANSPQSIPLTGTGLASSTPVTLSPTSIAFGATTVGTWSSLQAVTMTNSGSAALTITSIAVTGANASQFVFANTCGTSLAVGASCSIHGHFQPTSTGALSAAITITDSATGSPQSIALTGTGVASSTPVTLAPTSIAFGGTTVDTWSGLQAVTMTNTGSAALSITSIAVTGANASQFIFANTCGTSLAVGASCSIHGHFQPTSTGALSAAITITDSATNSPQSIPLTGTGLASSTPVTLSPTSIAFGGTTVDTWSNLQAVTMTNTGTAALSITSIAVTGANASQFVFANTCGTSLAVGASCSIHGHFQPTSTGALSAAITITDSATGSPQSIALTGTGLASSTPVTLAPTSIAFGGTTVDTWSNLQAVTMTNTGTAALSITSIAVTGANASQFVFANTCGTSLAVGASCSIHGHFQPTSTGALSAAITITDSASNSPQSIPLTGTGLASSTPVTLAPTSIAFGATTVGTWSGLQAVTMTNTGTAALSITSIAVTGANASQFVFANTCGTSLAVGASCSIHGHFQPTSTGAMSAAIAITDSAANSPQSISLSGTGQ